MTGKHYLYRHIRLDTNQPFYIGIGSKKYTANTWATRYNRAYSKGTRNKYWHNIVNKTPYEVEILMESDDYEFIKQKEIEFIALYGRKDLGKGTLVNVTDGGDGTLGMSHSKEKQEQIYSKIREMYNNEDLIPQGSKKVINTLTLEIYRNCKDAAEALNINASNMIRYMNGGRKNPTYCVYLENYMEGQIHEPKKLLNRGSKNHQKLRAVIEPVTGIVWDSVREAMGSLNMASTSLRRILNKGYKAMDNKYMYLDDYLKIKLDLNNGEY